MNNLQATVVGAGLAGCEAAMQLANRGVQVTLYEMKPHKMTPAHQSPDFGELVCSNSLKAKRVEAAGGLLKAELPMNAKSLQGVRWRSTVTILRRL